MTAPILELKDVHTSYGNIDALKGIALEVFPGEIVTIIGANGAGKSTTLMSICGIVPLKAGEIVYDGEAITGVAADKLPERGLCQVPEGRRIFPRLTVEDNLEMGAFFRKRQSTIESDIAHVYDLFPVLEERRRQLGGTLSGGEQQMLAIGRALMTNPKVLILDEATEGLAPLVREEIWRGLEILKQRGESILVIDKNLSALLRIGDRHHIMEKGRVVWTGNSAELAGDKVLQQRYLGV
jgi:branched-chain amino acid transport system ATP-binding protein